MNSPRTVVSVRLARWWREVRWFLRCLRKGYPLKVYRTISPHPAPPATLERLRVRILTGNWSDPLTDADYEKARKIAAPDLPTSSAAPGRNEGLAEASDVGNESGQGAV